MRLYFYPTVLLPHLVPLRCQLPLLTVEAFQPYEIENIEERGYGRKSAAMWIYC